MSKKVAFATLGCKVNKYETEAMSEMFKKRGYEVVGFDEISDIYVINTCTVTNIGDRKSRQMIRRAKHKNPHSIVAVTGCYAQVSPEEVKKIEGVNLVLGTNERKNIVDYVEKLTENEFFSSVSDIRKIKDFEDMPIEDFEKMSKAYIKIEEGCNEFCSYCIIPYARGPVRSRSILSIEKEAKRLSDAGFKEVILTGIQVASYGKDLDGLTLADVIELIAEKTDIERIRLSSIEPRLLTDEFIERIKNTGKICPHFHISLQSGCDETLKRMNRKYTTKDYLEGVKRLRKSFDNPAITTDVMVGFPGEDDTEFEKSRKFMETVGFSDAHVFEYSNRKGTRADLMEGQVANEVKNVRSEKMRAAVQKLKEEYMKSFVGKELSVLFEQEKDGYFEGTSQNYIRVLKKSDEDLTGKIKSVKITKFCKEYLEGI